MRARVLLVALVVVSCKTKKPGGAALDAAPPPEVSASASAAPAAPANKPPVVIAGDARAVAGHFALIAATSPESWHVISFDASGTATTLGSETVTFDHAVLAAGTDGVLVAVTLLDDRSGGVFRFAPGGPSKLLISGTKQKAMLTSVAGGGDYVFAGDPLVRVQRSTGKTKALGVSDVVQLAVADATLYVATQKGEFSGDTGRIQWTLRSTPVAATTFTEVAKGDGTVYGLAAAADVVAWSTMDSPALPPDEAAKGSVWIRRGKTAPVRLAKDLATPTGIALDATHVYFALRGGSIARVPMAGGAVETIASELDSPVAVAVDEKRVYTIASSRAQMSAPYAPAYGFISEPGDLLAFDKP